MIQAATLPSEQPSTTLKAFMLNTIKTVTSRLKELERMERQARGGFYFYGKHSDTQAWTYELYAELVTLRAIASSEE
jgi:hypothetical protein